MERVQKIRKEVEKLHGNPYYMMAVKDVLEILDMQEEPVSEFLNTESMIESYKQRLISQANGMKNNPLIDICLASYKHGINETLDTLNLSNVQRTVKNWKEPVSEELEEAANAYISNENNYSHSRTDTFKAGAKWQRQKDEHLIWQTSTANYEKGIEEGKQQMMKDATIVTVHIDAGNYPYIPQLELYDYDNDIALAKEGDKYKVVLIKE